MILPYKYAFVWIGYHCLPATLTVEEIKELLA